MNRSLVVFTLLVSSITLAGGCTRAPVGATTSADGRTLTFKDVGTPAPDMPCACPKDTVWRIGSCVPTVDLETCGEPCAPAAPGSCGGGRLCDAKAATANCASSVPKGACVPGPAMGFAPGTLRIAPTSGTAGKEIEIVVRGGDYYIGALHWIVSVGNLAMLVNQAGRCELRFKFSAPKPGVHAVTVGYGAKGQALAGFFTASGGVPAPKWIQPGYTCGAGQTCAQQPPYNCSCKAGRCACERK